MKIIDLSRHNGQPDWPRVLPQIDGAIIRCSLGSTGIDSEYARNWLGVQPLSRRGVYHYNVTETHPLMQVENIFRTTGGDFGTLPVTLDCERREDEKLKPFDRRTYTDKLRSIVNEFKRRTNHPLRIYTSATEWEAITVAADDVAQVCGLHVADWRSVPAPLLPDDWPAWELWQYSAWGVISGIRGDVDLSREPKIVQAEQLVLAGHAQAILELV